MVTNRSFIHTLDLEKITFATQVHSTMAVAWSFTHKNHRTKLHLTKCDSARTLTTIGWSLRDFHTEHTSPRVLHSRSHSFSDSQFGSAITTNTRATFWMRMLITPGAKNKPTFRPRIRNAKSEPRQSGLTLCVPVSGPDTGHKKRTVF